MPIGTFLVVVAVLDSGFWLIIHHARCPRQLHEYRLVGRNRALRSKLNPSRDSIQILSVFREQHIGLLVAHAPLQHVRFVRLVVVSVDNLTDLRVPHSLILRFAELLASHAVAVEFKRIICFKLFLAHVQLTQNLILDFYPCNGSYVIQYRSIITVYCITIGDWCNVVHGYRTHDYIRNLY